MNNIAMRDDSLSDLARRIGEEHRTVAEALNRPHGT